METPTYTLKNPTIKTDVLKLINSNFSNFWLIIDNSTNAGKICRSLTTEFISNIEADTVKYLSSNNFISIQSLSHDSVSYYSFTPIFSQCITFLKEIAVDQYAVLNEALRVQKNALATFNKLRKYHNYADDTFFIQDMRAIDRTRRMIDVFITERFKTNPLPSSEYIEILKNI